MIKNTIICARGLAVVALLTFGGATNCFAATYAPGTVAIKPLNFNIASLVVGFRDPDSIIDAPGSQPTKTDSFRSPISLGFNETDRNAWAYGFELAVMLGWDLELLARAGYSLERPVSRYRAGNRTFDFGPRENFHASFGLRKYFDMESVWVPYVGATGGFISQGKTCADIYDRSGFGVQTLIGDFTLLKRKTLGTFEVHAGTDYKFSDLWVLSFSVAARYIQSGGSTTHFTTGPTVNGNVTFTDNKQHWYFPFTVSLKITL